MNDLTTELLNYGADRDRLVDLSGEPSPAAVRYVDLVRAAGYRPHLVVEEATGMPVAYVVDARFQDPGSLQQFRHHLALRGEAAFLVVVRPGLVEVYPVDLGGWATNVQRVEADSREAGSLFPRLHLTPEAPPAEQAVHQLLFDLMKAAIDALRTHRDQRLDHLLTREDALSLAGRAVFLRFLLDRGLLPPEEWQRIAPGLPSAEAIFDQPAWTIAAFEWLDRTFNGDFLHIEFPYAELAERLSDGGWAALRNILLRARNGQLLLPDVGGEIQWQGLDFGRIPVGVLSQVYEHQAMAWAPDEAREKSAHYTPVGIAEFMVREVFASLDIEEEAAVEGERRFAHQARVLDPAVGGGVFLVAAFRALIARRWRADEAPPNTAALREILYGQLAGFDVEPTALRLTALSLYLAAIEQDPNPHPLESLRFERPLLGEVLFPVGGEGLEGQAGSLGPRAPAHSGRYDVVIGNPPWTTTKRNLRVQRVILETLRPIVQTRLGEEAAQAFSLPDDNKDVAFLWRALDWCRPGGRIAQVVHARLLFRRTPGGQQARDQLLSAFQWTGVLNGTALRQTRVWPNIAAPFAIVFGFNSLPVGNDGPYIYSPWLEEHLNERGRLRIDAEAAEPLSQAQLRRNPWLLKTLFRGTRLDVGVVDKVLAAGPALADYWETELHLSMGQGYQVAENSGRRDARFLLNFPDVTPESIKRQPVRLRLDELPPFRRTTLWRPRDPAIYRCPLVLVRKGLSANSRLPSAYLAEGRQAAAFTESFYGFSAAGHANAAQLAPYLLLILSSPLPRWFTLMTGSQYGIEREVHHAEDLERLPIPRLEELPRTMSAAIGELAGRYEQDGRFGPDQQAWLRAVYGLDQWDWQVIVDTLAVGAPERKSAREAQRPPRPVDMRGYAEIATNILGQPIRSLPTSKHLPWQLLAVGTGFDAARLRRLPLDDLLHLADQHQASQMIMPVEGGALVAILKQYRFWTPTRARLLALDLMRRLDA